MSKNKQSHSLMYRKYSAYKPTGIEWLGKVPEKWEVKRLKYAAISNARSLSEKTPEDYRFKYLDIGNVGTGFVISEPSEMAFDNAPSRARRIVTQHDTIISTVRTYLKAIYYFEDNPQDIIVSTGFAVIKPGKALHSKYFYYLSLSVNFIDSIVSNSYGVSYPAINESFLMTLPVWYPSLEQQKNVVEFLDRKTGLIDDVIDRKQKLIKLLKEKRQALITNAVTKGLNPNAKLKPSGIDCLGDMPKTWESKRLKYISNTRVSNVDKKSEDETPVKLCNYVDVYKNEFVDDTIEFMEATATLNQIDAFELKLGDIIITKDSETPDDIGVPASVKLKDTKHIVCGYHLAIMTSNNTTLFGGYLFRVLQSSRYRAYFETRCNGVTRFGLGTYSILNVEIPLPAYDEQQIIAEFLDRETAKIDSIVTKVKSQVWKLREYKQALITSAVTGKIKVSE